MDDLYAINAAKSEFRECFNLADTSRVLAIADPDPRRLVRGSPMSLVLPTKYSLGRLTAYRAEGQSASGLQGLRHPVATAGAMALFAFAACYFRLFILPDVPLLPSGDQVGFAEAGSRIVAGQLPYRDYFQIVPPGTDFAYALLIRLFGLRTWTPHLVMATLAAVATLLITLISMRVLRGLSVVLPGLLLVGFLLLVSMDGTHHWFSTVAALAALLVLLGGTTLPQIAAAGALCGLTACFTQNKGATVLVGFVVYLVWKASLDGAPARAWLRQCAALVGVAACTFAVANVYFVSAVGMRRWLYCLVVYPLRYYPSPAINNWRVVLYDFASHQNAVRWVAYPFVYATVPLACVVFLLATRRRWRQKDPTEPWGELVLIALTGIFMFLAVAASPSVKRLGSVGPPAMVSLAWMLSGPGRVTRWLKMGLVFAAIGMVLVASVVNQTRWRAFLDLPAGRTAFHDKLQYEEYGWVLQHTHPRQFFLGVPMYFPFHVQNPSPTDGYETSEYTRPEQVTELLQALKTHFVPLMILPSAKQYPRRTGLPSDHLGPFRNYLCRNYSLTRTLATGDEVWERRDLPTNCPPQ